MFQRQSINSNMSKIHVILEGKGENFQDHEFTIMMKNVIQCS